MAIYNDAIATRLEVLRPDELILGLPIGLAGTDTAQTGDVRALALRLRSRLGIRVTLVDERLSSVEAARSVKGADRRRKGDLDSAAAAVVLQSVLDSRRARLGS